MRDRLWRAPVAIVAILFSLLLAGNEEFLGPWTTMIVLMLTAPTALAWLVRRLLGQITWGLETIALIFLPSFLVFHRWIGPGVVERTQMLFETADLITCFTTVLIFGSVLSIERNVLLAALAKICIPVVLGSLVAIATGILAGVIFGASASHTFFHIVAPVMAGGINSGALPLAVGYASVLDGTSPGTVAQMISAVILGNGVAVLIAGLLGGLANETKSMVSTDVPPRKDDLRRISLWPTACALLLLILAYGIGKVISLLFAWPTVLTVLLVASGLQMLDAVPASLRRALISVYQKATAIFTYPILFTVGLFLTPWSALLDSFALANVVTVGVTVATLATTGFIVARLIGFPPLDGALVTLTRSAMGGTGDLAILSAARRLDLMAYAQVATRIGGVATVAGALLIAKTFH